MLKLFNYSSSSDILAPSDQVFLVALDVVCEVTTDLSALRLHGDGSQEGLIALWRPGFT